jgi:Fanconi anemia group M protein
VAVERKTDSDFWSSLFESRQLIPQIKDLKTAYEKPLLILEGTNLHSRGVDPNVIRGLISAITVDFRVPIIFTENQYDTAMYLARIAKREQIEESHGISVHGKRSHMSEDEKKEYIISSICNIGPTISKRLLERFSNIKNIINASEAELTEIKNIGPVTAKDIVKILSEDYSKKKL